MNFETNFLNNLVSKDKKEEEPQKDLAEQIEEKRQRVDKMREYDISGENSIVDMAKEEDKYREDLKINVISDKNAVDMLSDEFSDEILDKKEKSIKEIEDKRLRIEKLRKTDNS